MSFNLDDLFDTRPQQRQQETGTTYVIPPPPSDPPPPPVLHHDPFVANVAPPPPPPFDTVTPNAISANALPATPSHPLYASPETRQPYNPNVYAVAPLSLPCHPGQVSSIPSQTQYHSSSPAVPLGVYGSSYQTPAGPTTVPYVASNVNAPSCVPPSTVSNPGAMTYAPRDGNSTLSQEEEDRKQLEKIIQLRKELEREREKRKELETWGCPSCTYRNALTLNQCEICETNRPGYNPPPKSSTRGETMTSSQNTVMNPLSTVAGPTAWLCSICLAPNEAHHTRCKVCNSYQKNGTPIAGENVKPTSVTPSPTVLTNAWLCSICGKKNGFKDVRCGACSAYQSTGTAIIDHEQPPPSATDSASATWKCSVCTLENPVGNEVCEACQSGQRPRHLAHPKGKTKTAGDESNSGQSRMWPCPTCTFQNPIATEKCDVCTTGRPSQYKPPAPPSNTKENSDVLHDEIQWQEDRVATNCNRCHQPFNLTRRRHHCRMCGFVFCGPCSVFQLAVKKNGSLERVCASCFEAHK